MNAESVLRRRDVPCRSRRFPAGMLLVALVTLLPAPLFAEVPRAGRALLRPGVKGGGSLTRAIVDTFVPLWAQEDRLLFVNPHIVLTDAHENEGNFGLGYRQLVSDRLILGANLYYDERESHYGNPFHQLGWGLEALTPWVEGRLNVYHPLSPAKRVPTLDAGSFTETQLLRFNGYEEPLPGLDYEAAVLVPYLSRYLETRVALGGFWYNAKHGKDVDGHRLRLELRPNDWLTFDVEWKALHGGKSETFVGGSLSLPFDVGACFQRKNPFTGWREVLRVGHRGLAPSTRVSPMPSSGISTSRVKPNPMLYIQIPSRTWSSWITPIPAPPMGPTPIRIRPYPPPSVMLGRRADASLSGPVAGPTRIRASPYLATPSSGEPATRSLAKAEAVPQCLMGMALPSSLSLVATPCKA